MLHKEMISQGQWLFRWRSYLPILFFVLFLPAIGSIEQHLFSSHRADLIWEGLCLLIGLLGLLIRCLVVGYVPRNTSGRNTHKQIAESLNTKGMYTLLRNPLYLGNFFMWSAPILLLHNGWLYAVYVLTFILYYERIIATEEFFLADKFGDMYINWAAKTPMLFPRHFHWQTPDLPFSWKTVIRREYHGFYGLIATMTAVEYISEFMIHNILMPHQVWNWLFVISTIIYLIVRFLAKKTNIFKAEGRY